MSSDAPASAPMLRITRSATAHQQKCTPSLLPLRVNYSGPVNASARYWDPQPDKDAASATRTAYFRGRKLRGREIGVPQGYRGAVLQKTDTIEQEKVEPFREEMREGEGDELDDDFEVQMAECGVVEEVAAFDEFVVWGHEVVPEKGEDEFARGVEEWIAMAEAMHAYNPPDTTKAAAVRA